MEPSHSGFIGTHFPCGCSTQLFAFASLHCFWMAAATTSSTCTSYDSVKNSMRLFSQSKAHNANPEVTSRPTQAGKRKGQRQEEEESTAHHRRLAADAKQ